MKAAIYDLYDENEQYVGDFTLQELCGKFGLSKSTCSRKLDAGEKLEGCRGEKVDTLVTKESTLWIEYEIARKRILDFIRRRTK